MSLINAIESFIYWAGSQLTIGDTDLACDWRAPIQTEADVPPDIMALKSGSVVSFIEIKGIRRYVGTNEFETLAENLAKILSNRMKAGNGRNHSMTFCFRSDPAGSLRLAKELMAPMSTTAKRLGMTEMAFFDARVEELSRACTDEAVYIAVFTHRAGMNANEQTNQAERQKKAAAELRTRKVTVAYNDMFSQSLAQPSNLLVTRHKSMIENLVKDLSVEIHAGGTYLLANAMSVREAANMVRRVFDHSDFPSTWAPRFLGDKGSLGASPIKRTDEATVMPVALSRQMMPTSFKEEFKSFEFARQGSTLTASVVVEVLPEEGSQPFNKLMEKLGRTIPLAYAQDVLPSGLDFRKADQFFGSFMAAMGDFNKGIKRGWDQLKTFEKDGDYIAATRMTLTTWAKTEEQLQFQVEYLRSSIEAWGSTVCSNETGEPALAAISTAAGFSRASSAPYLPAPIKEITRMSPVVRAASIWKTGQLIASTLDGRPYPIALGSGLQTSWATVGFAPTGSGKSFFMNLLNSGLLMAPGAQDVPYVTVVDVGPSSRLIMDLYRAMLPASKRDQVVSIRIKNAPEYTVNPFDTFLGLDQCTEQDRDFIVAVLGTICPGLGPEADKFFQKLIAAAYERFSRTSSDAKPWQNAMDPEVGELYQRLGNEIIDGRTRVWDVVDALFKAGHTVMAERAQRYAMPILKDLSKVVSQADIMLMYGEALAANGAETIIKVFQRNLSAASTGTYTLLSSYTQANLGSARAISIDLEEVVGSTTSEEGRRRSALMFLFARRLGAKNFFARWDEIAPLCPDLYRRYQKDRVEKMWEQMKFLEYDEVHYASGAESFQMLLQQDLRVGRKFNMVTMMMSQLISDFPEAIMANSTNFYVFGLGDGSMEDQVKAAFKLSEAEMQAIKTHCRRPGTLFARFATTEGVLAQVLKTTASPLDKWAFTTNAADAPVRAALAQKLGGTDDSYWQALQLLARMLPAGTAKPMIAAIMAEKGEFEVNEDSVSMDVAIRLIARAHSEGLLSSDGIAEAAEEALA
jgi:intracellular multiplication protein IcmB